MTYIEQYYQKILSGEEVVSNKIRITYKKLVHDIHNPKTIIVKNELTGENEIHRYVYDHKRATRILEFAYKFCRHSKGKWAGKPVELELWEKAALSAAFGFIDEETGNRKYKKVKLFVARKNGKSLIAAIVGNYMLTSDGEAGAEVYSIATKKDQAKIIWLEAKRMIKKSPALLKRVKPLVSELYYEKQESTFKPLSSESDSLDGLNAHCVLVDEEQAIKDKNIIDVTYDSMSAREQPMMFVTTSAGTVRESVFDDEYDYLAKIIDGYEDPESDYVDETILGFMYELDSPEEWTDEKCWKKANPGLGTIKNLKDLREKVNKAKLKPNEVSNLLCKDFNIRSVNEQGWLTYEQLNNTATFEIKDNHFKYGIGGVDLSSTTDLTSAKILVMQKDDPTIYSLSMYWIPEDLLEQRVKEDKIPYDKWVEKGLIRLCEGNKVNPSDVTKWFVEMRKYGIYTMWVGYDPWGGQQWVEEMKLEFGKEAMISIRQGAQTLSNPMKSLGADLAAKKINYNNNNVDKWCLSNTSYKRDENDNIKPVKGKNQRKRIDGTMSLLNAYTVLQDKLNEYKYMI